MGNGITIGLLVLANILLLVLVVRSFLHKTKDNTHELEQWMEQRFVAQDGAMEQRLLQVKNELTARNVTEMRGMSESLQNSVGRMSNNLQNAVERMGATLQNNTHNMGENLLQSQARQSAQLETRLKTLESTNEQKLDNMRTAIQHNMETMRQENAKKLDEIRHTVDEQLQDTLQKRISESFQSVTTQLEQVYKGLGEMQNLASDVGGLKQVLSGVKTRGILGEIQLGAILSEILTPEQYETNFNTIPNSRNRVEFAIRLPGVGEEPVWLPIDSKFPGDTYARLQDAYANGDTAAIEVARKALIQVLCSEAKDIREKYVEPPYTTNFGVLFLPFEGLYAEVVNLGLLERLQHDYHINVAGPSTMAALLSSLQMGFKTLAIQKRSNEVWNVLSAVKSEFGKFGDGLKKMQERIRQSDEELDKLIGVRTRAINRKLSSVQLIENKDTVNLLGVEEEI